jgi:hypothetical protein
MNVKIPLRRNAVLTYCSAEATTALSTRACLAGPVEPLEDKRYAFPRNRISMFVLASTAIFSSPRSTTDMVSPLPIYLTALSKCSALLV